MRQIFVCCLLLACLLVISEAGRRRRRRWKGSIDAGWSPHGGWQIRAGVTFSFGRKKRSAGLGLVESSKCIPTLPCKFEFYDTNEDKGITQEEFEDKLLEMGFHDRQYSIFTALDDDDNGTITQEEFALVAPDLANDIIFPECVQST